MIIYRCSVQFARRHHRGTVDGEGDYAILPWKLPDEGGTYLRIATPYIYVGVVLEGGSGEGGNTGGGGLDENPLG